jgi:hypothetical protein
MPINMNQAAEQIRAMTDEDAQKITPRRRLFYLTHRGVEVWRDGVMRHYAPRAGIIARLQSAGAVCVSRAGLADLIFECPPPMRLNVLRKAMLEAER